MLYQQLSIREDEAPGRTALLAWPSCPPASSGCIAGESRLPTAVNLTSWPAQHMHGQHQQNHLCRRMSEAQCPPRSMLLHQEAAWRHFTSRVGNGQFQHTHWHCQKWLSAPNAKTVTPQRASGPAVFLRMILLASLAVSVMITAPGLDKTVLKLPLFCSCKPRKCTCT